MNAVEQFQATIKEMVKAGEMLPAAEKILTQAAMMVYGKGYQDGRTSRMYAEMIQRKSKE